MTERVAYAVQVWDGERWLLVRGRSANPMPTREAGIRFLKTCATEGPDRKYRLIKQTTLVEMEVVA